MRKTIHRPYAIDVNTHVTKRETNSRRKAGYYATILSGKQNSSLWSVSSGEQFADSFFMSAKSDFTFLPEMRKVSTGCSAHGSK